MRVAFSPKRATKRALAFYKMEDSVARNTEITDQIDVMKDLGLGRDMPLKLIETSFYGPLEPYADWLLVPLVALVLERARSGALFAKKSGSGAGSDGRVPRSRHAT